MQPTEASKADFSAGVMPAPSPAVAWRVIGIEVLDDWCLRVRFADGTAGEVALKPLIDTQEVTGTVFEPLRNSDVFRQARVELGVVTWPSGADLAPDAMYDAIRARGRWIVE